MGATRRTSWMLGGTSDPASLNMLAGTRVLSSQPSQSVTIDWSNPLTRGLLGAFLPHLPVNLVDSRPMIPLQTPTRGAGAAGIELRSGALQYPAPVSSSAPEAKFDGTVGTALALCRQSSATNVGLTFGRYNGTSNPTWGVGLWGGSFNGPYAVWHSYTFSPGATFFNPVDKYRCIAVSGDGSTARVYSDGRLIAQGAYTATTPQYDTASARAVYCGPLSGSFAATNTFNALALYWNRALSAEELTKLAQNPWQIFIVEQPRPTLFQPVPKPSAAEPLTYSKVRFSQPQYSTGIAWGNSLSNGLTFAYNPAIGGTDIVSGSRRASPNNADGLLVDVAGPAGVGRWPVGGAVNFAVDTFAPPKATGQSITALAVLVNSRGRGSGAWIVSRYNSNATANLHWLLGTDTSNRPTMTAANTAGTGFSAVHQTTTSATLPQVVVGRVNGATVDVWLNGVKGTTSATITGTPQVAAPANSPINDPIAVGNRYPNFATRPCGPVFLALHWDRALTDAEIAAISANPWQLFEKDKSTFWVPV